MTEKKPRKLKPPHRATVNRIIHVSYTSDYLDYVGHSLEKEARASRWRAIANTSTAARA